MLQQFALFNASLSRGATTPASQLADRVRRHAAELADPDDVMLAALAVRNYMQYATREKDTAQYLLDVINSVMNVSSRVLAAAERQYNACSELVQSAEQLAVNVDNVQGHKPNMVVESIYVRRESFSGMNCMWYSSRDEPARRLLHCYTSDTKGPPPKTQTHIVHCSIQIPLSLLYGVDSGLEPAAALQKSHTLFVAVYENAALFPLFPEVDDDGAQRGHRLKDYYGRSTKREDMNMEITSPVVGVKLLNTSMSMRLPEPVYITVRTAGAGDAAMWDPALRTWSNNTPDCTKSHTFSDMVVIQCYRLGYVGLIQSVETGIYGGRTDGARFKISHPAIYVGSIILFGCLSCAILTYITCYSAIQMAKRAKHALINTWIAITLLCFIYTLGIYQTEDVKLCQILGLIIHYLSLSVLLWMVVSASSMYKNIAKHNPTVPSSDDEIPEIAVQKPILGIYLVGWGIALIVCGISGAVNLKDYAAYAHCFLSTAPALSALLIPAGILLSFLVILFLLIRCTIRNVNGQLSEGTQATDNEDLVMWEPPTQVGNELADRRSVLSLADSDTEDVEHSTIVQLRAQVIVLGLYMSVWTCGAVAVYRPFPAYLPYQEDICSIVYAVCATILGTFILFFYGIARSDVRAQWSMMQCYLRKSKKCCRNRSVFDANVQRDRALNSHRPTVGNDNISRSGSRSSNRTNSKTNNSGTFKGGAELNSHTLRESIKNASKVANIDLVVLNRQQYRSNNSVITSRDNSTPMPEIFYNQNQSNVARKFFKKQKQNMKRNCLDLPSRSGYATSPPPSDTYSGVARMLHSGSKVNNTNLHVEKGQQSDGGMKETRHVHNPNILEEEKPDNVAYKNYSWKGEDTKNRVMNIYTNVPETMMPQHQTIASGSQAVRVMRGSVSEECVPEMRTVSQQCSLAYSSASETMLDRSDQTLDTHSEMTSLQETQSALCSTNEITDTESFGQYIDFGPECKPCEVRNIDKSLQDISEECTINSEELNDANTPLHTPDRNSAHKQTPEGSSNSKDDKDGYFTPKFDSETCSANTSEHFENESDIYIPNYQMSEVSIRSHGLYAPSPGALCPPELSFSHEDLSNRYVNFEPAWRETIRQNPRFKAPGSCPDVREGSPVSASELEELYTRITSWDKPPPPVIVDSDVTVGPCDSDSCVSEVFSEAEVVKAETTV